MKNSIILMLLLLTLGCTTQTRYTQQSPEIDIVKSIIGNYVAGEWDEYAAHYADGATIFFNVTEDYPSNIQETIASQKISLEPFSSYSLEGENDGYEMVVTDGGETWVNFWGLWKGTLTATGETFEMPVHLTHQFVDGKIVKTFGYWNSAPIQIELMEIQAAAADLAEIDSLD
jgi:hypothetical protein